MYDTVSITQNYKPPIEVQQSIPQPFEWNNLIYVPNFSVANGLVSHYSTKLHNLDIRIDKVEITTSNSWHKFHSRFNHTDYTSTQVEQTKYALEDALRMNLDDAIVKKLAYGANVATSFPVYESFLTLNSKTFHPMIGRGGTLYGSQCFQSKHKVKAYDKAFDAKRNGIDIEPLQRFEIEVRYMPYLHKRKKTIPIFQVKDLLSKDVQWLLAFDLLRQFNKIVKAPTMKTEELDPKDQMLMAAWKDKAFRANLRRNNSHSYKSYLKQYRKLIEAMKSDDMARFEASLYAKLEDLIES